MSIMNMKSLFVFACLFYCPMLSLASGGAKHERVMTARTPTTTYKPENIFKKNSTLMPNLMVFGPEFQPHTPKKIKKLYKNAGPLNETHFLPKMMIFEPDRLFWPFFVETDVVPPFGMMSYQPTTKRRRTKSSIFTSSQINIQLIDRNKTILQIYPNLLDIFSKLQRKGIKMAVAETTPEIATIRHLLHLFDIDYMFPHMAIDLDSAVVHVEEIRRDSGLNYSDLVYFGSNKSFLNEIKRDLKVLTIHINPDGGLDLMHIYKAIYLYNLRPLIASSQGKLNITDDLLPDEIIEENISLVTTQRTKMKPSRKPRASWTRKPSRNTTAKSKIYPRTKKKT